MADYNSIYTGIQVDNAVSIALNLASTLNNYVPKNAINITIPSLTDGHVTTSQLPLATRSNMGIIMVGDGLQVSNTGTLSIDNSVYYTSTDVDRLLQLKANTIEVNSLSNKINSINNYNISIKFTNTPEDVLDISGNYYRLVIS